MLAGVDWAEMLRSFGEACGWTPRQFRREASVIQLAAAWGQLRPGDSSGGPPQHMDRAERLERLNRTRARRGLPPIPLTPASE